MLYFLRNQNVINTRYYKRILIRKDCTVKVECQMAFFFKNLNVLDRISKSFPRAGRATYV